MARLPSRRLVVAKLTWPRPCRRGASRIASIRWMRAFCLVLRALGPCLSQASSRRSVPLNLAAEAASDASSSALWVR